MAASRGKRQILSPLSKKKSADEPYKRRLYGRKQTRPPGKERQGHMDSLLPRLLLEITEGKTLNPDALYPRSYSQLWLEIGFGNGEHLAELMRRHPDCAYIGAEPFTNGMGAFLKHIANDPHENIRVWMDDAIFLVNALPDACLDGIYVLNPDPWPKKRHAKRRIISRENLDRFARVLKPGTDLIMSTDVDRLADWMTIQSCMHPSFEWRAERVSDWRITPKDWIPTRYEQKGAKAGRRQTYLFFKRI
jgi:tRNA (guanine-N7-)-methyltransferase